MMTDNNLLNSLIKNLNNLNKHIIKENITNNILKKYKFIILFKKVKSINEVYNIQNYFLSNFYFIKELDLFIKDLKKNELNKMT